MSSSIQCRDAASPCASTSTPKRQLRLVLEIGPDVTRPVSVNREQPMLVGGDVWMPEPAQPGETLRIRASGNAVVRINDVELRGVGSASPGDLIALPDRSLLIQRASIAESVRKGILSHELFDERFVEEVNRTAVSRSPLSLLLVHSRALLANGSTDFVSAPEYTAVGKRQVPPTVGHTAPGTLAFLCPGASTAAADDLRNHLSDALGRLGRPFRWGWATASPGEDERGDALGTSIRQTSCGANRAS